MGAIYIVSGSQKNYLLVTKLTLTKLFNRVICHYPAPHPTCFSTSLFYCPCFHIVTWRFTYYDFLNYLPPCCNLNVVCYLWYTGWNAFLNITTLKGCRNFEGFKSRAVILAETDELMWEEALNEAWGLNALLGLNHHSSCYQCMTYQTALARFDY